MEPQRMGGPFWGHLKMHLVPFTYFSTLNIFLMFMFMFSLDVESTACLSQGEGSLICGSLWGFFFSLKGLSNLLQIFWFSHLMFFLLIINYSINHSWVVFSWFTIMSLIFSLIIRNQHYVLILTRKCNGWCNQYCYGIHWVPCIQHREWFQTECCDCGFTLFHPCRTLSLISSGVCPSTYYHNRLIFFDLVTTGATTGAIDIWKGAVVAAGPAYKSHCMP